MALLVGLSPPLRLAAVVLLASTTIMTEILKGSAGDAVMIARRFAIYVIAVLAAVAAMFVYGLFAFHVLDEPPLDWLRMTAFVTFGWFLAQGTIGPFVDDLWSRRRVRVRRGKEGAK